MRYRPADYFVLRSPLLPINEFLAWSSGTRSAAALENSTDLDAAVAHDRALLRARLQEIVDRPDIREALFLASPDLLDGYDIWRRASR